MESLLTKKPQLRGHLVVEDILRAVDKIKVLGSGFRVVRVGHKSFIVSVPMEINQDHEVLMDIAQTTNGKFTQEMLVRNLSWPEERFNRVLNELLKEVLVWIDSYQGVDNFYFWSLWKPIDV